MQEQIASLEEGVQDHRTYPCVAGYIAEAATDFPAFFRSHNLPRFYTFVKLLI